MRRLRPLLLDWLGVVLLLMALTALALLAYRPALADLGVGPVTMTCPNGNCSIPTPNAGVALTVNGITDNNFLTATDGVVTGQFRITSAPALQIGTSSPHNLYLEAGGAARLLFSGATGAATLTAALISGGTTFTLGSGTGACATTSTLTGGQLAGSFLCTGTAGASTQVINLPTATNGWSCWASDETAGTSFAQSAHTASSVTIKGTIGVSSDRVAFGCVGY